MLKNSATPKILNEIKNYLRIRIGLKPESVGDDFIHRAIEQRVRASRSPNLVTYFANLQASTTELQSLTELLSISETWFFRNKAAFQFFRTHVVAQQSKFSPYQPLKILSLPCSTGEEPYSLVITLLELGLSPKNFKIDAVDISHQSIQYAKHAIYSQYSFRQSNPSDYSRYFQSINEGYKLDSYIVNQVNFRQGNVLDPLFTVKKTPYHIIFCRNLLIYFDQKSRNQTLRILNNLLYEQGLLFVGHAESSQLKHRYLKLITQPSVFAYQKVRSTTQLRELASENSSKLNLQPQRTRSTQQDALASQHNIKKLKHSKPSQISINRQINSLPVHQPVTSTSHSSCVPPSSNRKPQVVKEIQQDQKPSSSGQEFNPSSVLEIARQSANMGQLDHALHLCQDYCKQHPTSPSVYLLLGEIHQAQGQDKLAIKALEKAIYLDSNYYDALVQLVLLKESNGEFARAANLRQRIQRLTQQEVTETGSHKH